MEKFNEWILVASAVLGWLYLFASFLANTLPKKWKFTALLQSLALHLSAFKKPSTIDPGERPTRPDPDNKKEGEK